MLTFLENIIANISENHMFRISENIIDENIENSVAFKRIIRWHILSRRETHYVISLSFLFSLPKFEYGRGSGPI